MNTFTPAIGSRNTSSAVCSTPSAPARISSNVIGFRSGPGSTTLPESVVPKSGVRLTVVNENSKRAAGLAVAVGVEQRSVGRGRESSRHPRAP